MRMVIYLDSNALFSDWRLARQYSKDFLAVLQPDTVEVGLSPVVLAEIKRQSMLEARTAFAGLQKATRAITRTWSTTVATVAGELERIEKELTAESVGALGPLTSHPACRVIDWPRATVQAFVERELRGLRPTKLSGDQTIGFRDSVIWQTILEDVASNLDDEDVIIFVTKDAGFLTATKAMHPDLEDDLRKKCISPSRATIQPDLAGATLEAQRFRNLISERDSEAREIFLNHVRHFTMDDWTIRTATLKWSDLPFPNDLANMEDLHVIGVEFEEVESEVGSQSVVCEVVVELTFEGSMDAREYFSGEYETVQWYSGEREEPYLSVITSRAIVFEAEIRVSPDGAVVVHESLGWPDAD